MIARRVVITGRVHGVGFRESLVHIANREGLTGWVRNVRDGTVEALLQGEPEVVDRVLEWCRQGPRAARVDTVTASRCELDAALREFARRPTV